MKPYKDSGRVASAPQEKNKITNKHFPKAVDRLAAGQPYTKNSIGTSGDLVLIFRDMVLKIGGTRNRKAITVRVTRWLAGKLPVPRVLAHEQEEDRDYLLMSRIRGVMACNRTYCPNQRPCCRCWRKRCSCCGAWMPSIVPEKGRCCRNCGKPGSGWKRDEWTLWALKRRL